MVGVSCVVGQWWAGGGIEDVWVAQHGAHCGGHHVVHYCHLHHAFPCVVPTEGYGYVGHHGCEGPHGDHHGALCGVQNEDQCEGLSEVQCVAQNVDPSEGRSVRQK